MAEFVPKLHPGRADKLGPIVVPHDIFQHVVNVDTWSTTIDTYQPETRRMYLEAILYWMDTNSACVVRNASTGRYAMVKDIDQCATILPGNVLTGGKTDPIDPINPEIPDAWTLSLSSPWAITESSPTELRIYDADGEVAPGVFNVAWGDGTTEVYESDRGEWPGKFWDAPYRGNITVTEVVDGAQGLAKTIPIFVGEYMEMSAQNLDGLEVSFSAGAGGWEGCIFQFRQSVDHDWEDVPFDDFPITRTYPEGTQDALATVIPRTPDGTLIESETVNVVVTLAQPA